MTTQTALRSAPRRAVLGGILALPAVGPPPVLPLLASADPGAPAADPVHAAISHHAGIWAGLGPMPDDEEGADFAAWETHNALAWSTWRRLVGITPKTRAGCIALARYVASHPLSVNVDCDDSLARALNAIADTLADQEVR